MFTINEEDPRSYSEPADGVGVADGVAAVDVVVAGVVAGVVAVEVGVAAACRRCTYLSL